MSGAGAWLAELQGPTATKRSCLPQAEVYCDDTFGDHFAAADLVRPVVFAAVLGVSVWVIGCFQDLVARGVVAPGRGLGLQRSDDAPEICREVTINSAAPQIRNHLTKRSTQDDIARRTGTSVVVRGRFMPPGAQPDSAEDKALCLRVTPGVSQAEVGRDQVMATKPS